MIDNLPSDLIIDILKKLYNYDILNVNQLNIKFKELINSDYFIKYLRLRDHPLVLDTWDTYCHKCNFHVKYLLVSSINNCIWCKH